MVLHGQDAWRRHPLLYQNWKRPFPGLGIAVGIFTTYCIIDQICHYIFTPKPGKLTNLQSSKYKFKETEDIDQMPQLIKKSSHH